MDIPGRSLAVFVDTLYITCNLEDNPSGGREMLSKINYDVLKDILGDNLVLIELPRRKLQGLKSQLSAFNGYIDGLSADTMNSVLAAIQEKSIAKVLIDGSNLGELARAIKKRFSSVEVIIFFHNVESRFFWGSFRLQKSLRSLAIFVANFLAERKSVLFSDKRICLSQRDSALLKKVYSLGATHIAPMCVRDKLPIGSDPMAAQPNEKFVLFVGGNFYANRVGIIWFVKNVVKYIDIPICIVGRGLEQYRQELEIPGKVRVIGAVDSLAEWYHNAQFVIAPIFDGSGMKTKVAEALMYGKKVVGTPEAFSGYEEIVDQAGWVCRTPEEFVSAIRIAQNEIKLPFDKNLRTIYENMYSFNSAKAKLATLVC